MKVNSQKPLRLESQLQRGPRAASVSHHLINASAHGPNYYGSVLMVGGETVSSPSPLRTNFSLSRIRSDVFQQMLCLTGSLFLIEPATHLC